jgi:carboxyl-terminal processing protease
VAEKLRGPPNTKVKLTIRRQHDEKPIEMVITRAVVRVISVRWHLEAEDVGYIRISQFNEQTTSGLQKAIADLKAKKGEKLKGFILDLRNNPGGLIDQAITVANAFLKQGEILSTRGRSADGTQIFRARAGKDISDGKPVIALINGGSASASEIVAGALQDHKRATVVGTRSFGKGSVQTLIPLGREHGALSLTTARYFTPLGRSIQAKGISPDIVVEQDIAEELKSSADATSEAGLRGHLLAEGQEQIGSQSYVPSDLRHDKAVKMALDLTMGASSIHPSHRNRVADIGDLSIDALGSEQGLQLRDNNASRRSFPSSKMKQGPTARSSPVPFGARRSVVLAVPRRYSPSRDIAHDSSAASEHKG